MNDARSARYTAFGLVFRTMPWVLKIQTGKSGDHEIDFGEDEAAAKEALARAQETWKDRRGLRSRGGGALATFEDRVVVPAADVTAISLDFVHPPAIG
jgi:hypothetical protein